MSSGNQKWIVLGAIVAGIFGLAVILYLNVRPEPGIAGVVQHPRPTAGHDNSVVYPYEEYPLPPPGDVHWDAWQNCGIYDEPVATEHVLHSLEHGAVWITYQPGLDAAEVARLRERVEGESYLLLSPYPNLQSPIVLTAWGLQLEVQEASDRRIEQFINRYRQGSQTPEPGATCDRGVGNPIDSTVQ
jgi:hypothetical protein